MQSNIIVTAVVVIYLLVMLLIGYLSSKKIESNTDFVVAGRRLGPFLMAGTLAATEIGGGSSLGVQQWLKPFLNISAVVMENLQESLHL